MARAIFAAIATLYRCPNRTDWLCPCGRVARKLRKHGIEHEVVRVPYRRHDRPEVDALTGQRHVPVVVLEGEAICDSRRIVEHLRWRRDQAGEATAGAPAGDAGATGTPA